MLSGNKDVDLYNILMQLDNNSLLDFCKASGKREYEKKICKNEDFFRNYMYKHYPNLIKFKPYDFKWKTYYLKIVFYIGKLDEDFHFDFTSKLKETPYNYYEYIGKLEEEFDFKYTNSSKGQPENYYNIIVKYKNVDAAFEESVRRGYKDLAEYFQKKLHDYVYNSIFPAAVSTNDQEIIDYLIELGANDWNAGLEQASINGNMKLIDFFINKDADINHGLYGAAIRGDKELIDYFIDKGANDWGKAVTRSALGKNSKTNEIVLFFISKASKEGINVDWNSALRSAAQSGNLELIEYFIDVKGATDLNGAMKSAISYKQYEIIDYLISKGASNWDSYIQHAKIFNSKLVKFFQNKK